MSSRQGFYEAVAQIIPILFLALAVGESRLKSRRNRDPFIVLSVILGVALTMLAGELAALRVLFTESDSEVLRGLCIASLALGFTLVLDYLGQAAFRDLADEDAEMPTRIRWLLDVSAAIVICGTVLLLGL
jgi:hypothetical protein